MAVYAWKQCVYTFYTTPKQGLIKLKARLDARLDRNEKFEQAIKYWRHWNYFPNITCSEGVICCGDYTPQDFDLFIGNFWQTEFNPSATEDGAEEIGGLTIWYESKRNVFQLIPLLMCPRLTPLKWYLNHVLYYPQKY